MTNLKERNELVKTEINSLLESLQESIPCNINSKRNQKLAKRFEKDVAAYFKSLSVAFPYNELDRLYYKYLKESLTDDSGNIIDPVLRTLNTSFKAKVAGHLTTIYVSGSAEMMDYGGLAYEGIPNQEAINWAEKHAAKLVTGMDKVTKSRLAITIRNGIENKRGVPGLGRDIRREIQDMSVYRGKLIASTETSTALGKAFMDRGNEMGVEAKEWITVGDDRVSEGCLANEAQGVIPFNQTFQSGHATPPRFPGCRCCAAPARLK